MSFFSSQGDKLTLLAYEKRLTSLLKTGHPQRWRCFVRLMALFTLVPHRLSLFILPLTSVLRLPPPLRFMKVRGFQTLARWLFRNISLPSSRSAGFPSKVIFLASTSQLEDSLTSPEVSRATITKEYCMRYRVSRYP